MIEFTHATTRYTVKPENAQAYRATLDKPKKHKFIGTSRVNLERHYPAFAPGWTTSEYVRLFQMQFDGSQHPVEFTHADRVAPMLDATEPEVMEELDPDYVPPVWTPSPKKATVASLKATIAQALTLLQAGDVDTAQCVLTEAVK